MPALQAALSASPAVILTADTGSGKTTWLPLQLLGEPWLAGKKIIMLEPRRVAARAAASRLAFHAGDGIGKTVGYSVRFDSKVSGATRLEVVTEGVLARRIVNDPELKDVGLVIFDEFHERHVETDLALSLTLESLKVFRPDLRMLIMSATIDTTRIATFLQSNLGVEIPIVTSAGTNYPVEIRYYNDQLPTRSREIAELCARKAIEAHAKHDGDILVFLPGKSEIAMAVDLIEDRKLAQTTVLPLHGELSAAEQDLALEPAQANRRRIIVATPIAESSLTVDGLSVVIDSGLVRQPAFDPGTGISHLETVAITQDSAQQRAGRAGRVKPGICYRIYHEADFKRRPKTRPAEILRTDLADASLRTLSFGSRLRDLALIDMPSTAMLNEAERLLSDLGLFADNKLTELGQKAAAMPLSPRLAAMLAQSPTEETARLAAELSEPDARAVQKTYEQLLKTHPLSPSLMKRGGSTIPPFSSQEKGAGGMSSPPLLFAYPDRVGIRRDRGSFLLRTGVGVSVDKTDALAEAEFILAIDLADGKGTGGAMPASGDKNARLRHGIALSRAQVLNHFKEDILIKKTVRDVNGRPRAFEQTCLGAIVLAERETGMSAESQGDLLLQSVKAKGIESLLDQETADFCGRVELLRAWGENFPACDTETLDASMDQWLMPFLPGIRSAVEVTAALVRAAIRARFDYAALQRIDSLLPERLTLPSGASHRIAYARGKAMVSARIQEVFGMNTHPTLAGGKLRVTLELLSPGKQPIATTLDLPAFWKSTYNAVRKEMRGRYPKHFWPEDPLSMQGTTGTKKAFDRRKTG